MEAGLPGLDLGTLHSAMWEEMPDTGKTPNRSKKSHFLYQTGEQLRAVSVSRVMLPACHKGTVVARHSGSCAWACWAERSLCSPLVFTYHCPKSVCPDSNGSFLLAPRPAHKEEKLQLVCTCGAWAQRCVKYHFKMGCM